MLYSALVGLTALAVLLQGLWAGIFLRRDLLIGSAVLTLLLVIEIGIGVAVGAGTGGLTIVHIPLAMVIMGMVVWLPLRARSTS